MRTTRICVAAVVVCSVLSMASFASAQIMGPPLERGEVEFGYMHKWFHRDMEPYHPLEMKWEVNMLFARYGGFDWLTLSGEGLISGIEHDDFPGLRYQRFSLGGGITSRFYTLGPWSLSGCFHYNEVFDRDKSYYRFHKRTYGVVSGLQIGRTFEYRGQNADLWIGPMYIRDTGENYPWDSNEPIKNESSDDFGFAAGAHIVLFRHYAGVVNVVYADYFQARLGVTIRTGGAR